MTREAVQKWIKQSGLRSEVFVFPSRVHASPHLGTRQYARILEGWVEELGLDPAEYGTHSMRRTKATLIYRHTKNLRAVQLLLDYAKLESTVRYLGIEVDDALEISEQTGNLIRAADNRAYRQIEKLNDALRYARLAKGLQSGPAERRLPGHASEWRCRQKEEAHRATPILLGGQSRTLGAPQRRVQRVRPPRRHQ